MPGTLDWVKIFGVTYNVMGAADATLTGGLYEVTPIAHTGGSTPQRVRRTQSLTGVILHVNPNENDALQKANDAATIGNISFSKDGRVYRGTGFITHQGYTNQENAATVDLHSKTKDGFTLF